MNRKIKTFISINLLILSVLIGCSSQSKVSYAQSNGAFLTFGGNYRLQEFSNFSIAQYNTNNINISLPSARWNLTNLKMNFTDIKLGEELKSIEEGGTSFKAIYKTVKGRGVQLNITEDIELIGVHIYGYLELTPISPVYVQINGFNAGNPNATVYGTPIPINMSSIPGWYVQKFPEPIPLSKGYYYLVVNGSEYKQFDNSKHYWFLNEDNSNHTHLYTSDYISGSWLSVEQGKPFRYKLLQRTDQSYSPEAINMTVKVDSVFHSITEDIPGTGFVEVSDINLPLNQTGLNFEVFHNQSIELMINVSCDLELENYLASPGEIEIAETHDNYWSVVPVIDPEYNNYSVKFTFPKKWSDVSVLRNSVNITSVVDINYIENFVYIFEDFISEGDTWEISARSSKTEFNLDVSRTEFYVGQELKFFVASPVLEGNYTFVITDTFNDRINSTTKILPDGSNSFTYTIPSNALDGTYKAYVYWSNGTDAGVATQEFSVILPEVIDWTLIISLVVIVALGSAITASSVVVAKKKKRKKEAVKERTIHKFMDILNLNYVIVIEKKSSLNVYDQNFTEKKINSTLVSGFLEAIRTFGLDISGAGEHSQTVKLEYQNSKILMSDYKNFRLIFIMKEIPSAQFYEVIEDLSIEIEEKYGVYLKDFKGNLQPFEGIEKLLRKHLGTSFLYPLKLTGIGKMKISTAEKSLVNKAIEIMKKSRTDYFYVTQLIRELTFDAKEIEALYSLIVKRVFNPLS